MISLDPESPDYFKRVMDEELEPPSGSWPMSRWTKRLIIEEASRFVSGAEALNKFSAEDLRFLLLTYEATYLCGNPRKPSGLRHTRYYQIDIQALRELIREVTTHE